MPASEKRSSPGGYLAAPRSAGPGVLVLHAWWGLNDFLRGVCDRLADEGFVAFAPDLYHGPTASTIEEAERLRSTLKDPRVHEDLASGIGRLRAHTRVAKGPLGLLGFSLGAAYGLELAADRGPEFGAVIVYYGTGGGDYGKARAAFLGHLPRRTPTNLNRTSEVSKKGSARRGAT